MFMKWRAPDCGRSWFPRVAVRSLVCGRIGHFTRGKSPDGPGMPCWTLTRLLVQGLLVRRAMSPSWEISIAKVEEIQRCSKYIKKVIYREKAIQEN
ncbi:hypothetical protein TNIN_306791 [Trichonephila inaurata madagascariensis]|uniref:Uncharacterized protein n=1 Tax=Trichonephila inaurata madagascariensis TaxID=2747483 RepID=A0A8X6X0P0_9ARAC|nr:hypothetical protein TNIN_306791 [Trichonephila inaurata madagascariensis]